MGKNSSLIVKNGFVITLDPSNPVPGSVDILIEDGVFSRIAPDISPDYRDDDKTMSAEKPLKVIDAGGKVVMPGLVNAHMHLYSSLARGMSISSEPPENFPQILERMWWRLDSNLDEEGVYWSAITGLLDSLRSGTTTVFDHHASYGFIDGSLDIIEKACLDTGIRASLCFETSDRHGSEAAAAAIAENQRFLKKCSPANNPDDRIRALFGLHASFTCSDNTLEKAGASVAAESGIHVHVAEDMADVRQSLAEYGCTPVKRFHRCGLLNKRSIAVHCVHVDDDERSILKDTGTAVAHNPESNMNNGVGCADMPGMISQGISMVLGTDGFTADMIHSLRAANIIHKHNRRDPRPGFAESLGMLLNSNPDLTGIHFQRPAGKIMPGNHADFVIVDYNPSTPLNSDTLGGHFLFGLQYGRIDNVFVSGREVMKDGSSVLLDEREAAEKSAKCAKKMWKLM